MSPYFFNAGLFHSGRALAALAGHYADAIVASKIEFDVLFGPAYKGIPLVAASAIGLTQKHGRDTPWAFNRKEAKDHGEGGTIVGAPLKGRVLIVDDVITAGTAIREAVDIIRAQGATPVGVILSLDREERGQGTRSAVQEVEAEYGLPVTSILKMRDLLTFLSASGNSEQLASLERYRAEFGV
jgi:orotate phosphoribosyltransferase